MSRLIAGYWCVGLGAALGLGCSAESDSIVDIPASSREPLAGGTMFSPTPLRLAGGSPGERFGQSLTGVGDVNGDGYDDLAVGAPDFDLFPRESPIGQYGKVYLWFGARTGLRAQASQILQGSQEGERLADVSRAGDVNGDGYADVLIQGTLNYRGETGLHLYLGSATGLQPTPVWHLPLSASPRSYGGAGDFNGDGRADVIVRQDADLNIYPGTSEGLGLTPFWTFSGNSEVPYVDSGAAVGDFTGDGYADLILGQNFCDGAFGGKVVGFWGSASGLKASPDWGAGQLVGPGGCTYIGDEVAPLGDVNADGYADFVTSSGNFSNFDFDGALQVFLGGSVPATVPSLSVQFPSNNHGWIDASGIGDADGDGFNDLLVGLDYVFNPHNGKPSKEYPPMGLALAYPGGADAISASTWSAYDNTLNGNSFAHSTSYAGDLNGDGFADIVVGDDFADTTTQYSSPGLAYVYYGAGGAEPVGRSLWNLAAYEVGTDSELASGERASSASGFEVRCVGLGTQGRTFVKLELEVKPKGAEFDGQGLLRSNAWLDTGTAGVELRLPVDALASSSEYTFRARLVYRPDRARLTRHGRWFDGGSVVTNCDARDPDLDDDGICDDIDADDDGDDIDDDDDCGPRDADIAAGAAETPDDGVDQDCSGADTVTCFIDADGDRHGIDDVTLAEGDCGGAGVSDIEDDCDDEDPEAHPGAVELVDDGVDQDCDGADSLRCYVDDDADGFGGAEQLVSAARCEDEDLLGEDGDCDDSDPDVWPGAEEVVADGVDQDCSGADSVLCFEDRDKDGWGGAESGTHETSCPASEGLTIRSGDCDDDVMAIHPGARELTNDGIDQDCDGTDSSGTSGSGGNVSSGGSPTAGRAGNGNAGGVAAGGAASVGSGGKSSGPGGDTPNLEDTSGCGCRVVSSSQNAPSMLGALAFIALLCARRRARSVSA